jgi:double-strand break repair protein MRE11
MNIKLPIFTIHGNHDYPSNDFGKLSICDLLHVSNYANYFGKHTDLAEIIVKPVIIQK